MHNHSSRIICLVLVICLLFSVNSFALSVDADINGTYYFYNIDGVHSGTTSGNFVACLSNIAKQLGYLTQRNNYQHQSIINTLDNYLPLYNSTLGQILNQFTYAGDSRNLKAMLLAFESYITAIGANVDYIRTDTSIIKTSISNIENYLSHIHDKFMDITISDDQKTVVSDGINSYINLIPLDDDNNLYSLNLTPLIETWSNGGFAGYIRMKNNRYTSLTYGF